MILIWRDSTPPGEYTDGTVENYFELTEDLIPNACEAFPGVFPPSTLSISTEGLPADFFYAGPLFIASGDLCECLKKFGVHAEFFRLTVSQQNKRFTAKEFHFVNILDAVDCFDFENSEYTMTDHGAAGIRKLVIDERKAPGHHLFQVGEIPSAHRNRRAVRDIIRCASDELASAVIRSGFTGVIFVRPEHWRDHPASAVAWRQGAQ